MGIGSSSFGEKSTLIFILQKTEKSPYALIRRIGLDTNCHQNVLLQVLCTDVAGKKFPNNKLVLDQDEYVLAVAPVCGAKGKPLSSNDFDFLGSILFSIWWAGTLFDYMLAR